MQMFLFIVAIIGVLIGAGVFVYGIAMSDESNDSSDWGRGFIKGVGVVVILVACLMGLGSMFRIVGGTEVAVPVRLGKPGAPLDRGPHMIAPWTKVTRFTTTYQVRELDVPVEGSDGGKMLAKVKVRYRILVSSPALVTDESLKPCSVSDLFQFVRSEDALETLIVDGDAQLKVRNAFRGFTAFEGYTNEQTTIVEQAAAAIALGWKDKCVQLDTLTIVALTPDAEVQAAINTALAARQNVDKAEQDRLAAQQGADASAYAKVAAAQAEFDAAQKLADANDVLDASLTPAVLQRLYILGLERTQNRVIYVPSGATPVIDVAEPTPTTTP